VIVGLSGTAGDATEHAFKYSGGAMTDLGTLGGTYSGANGESANGNVIVGGAALAGDVASHAFKYAGSTMSDLGTLVGGTYSDAYAVSADGSVIVGYSETAVAGQSHAFKYSVLGGMSDLGTPVGGTSSFALAASADGSVIVGYSATAVAGQYHAFKYSVLGAMSDLGTLVGGTSSYAIGVSADGSVIVGYSDTAVAGQYHAFKYSVGAMSDLGTLGGSNSRARAVYADGSVIFGYSDTAVAGVSHAFAWRGGKMIDLPETYADLARSASSIRNTIALRTSSMALMMDYDCRAFGQHNTCISFGGRYGDLNASTNEGAGILTAAYRVSPSVRVGAFIDHRVTQSKPAGINYSDDTPSIGAFVAYDDRGNGTGMQGKLTAVYNTGKVGVTRLASSAYTEAGSGRSSLTSYAVGAELVDNA
jgi:probable HAF family extracellular repeat protein